MAVTKAPSSNERHHRRAQAAQRRYLDGYRVANSVNGFGQFIKVSGWVLGLVVWAGVAQVTGSGAGGFVFGLIVAATFFVIGVIAAHGQLIEATLDTAVHSSPFLTNDARAAVMSLPGTGRSRDNGTFEPPYVESLADVLDQKATGEVPSGTLNCPNCGVPNSAADFYCSFCRANLHMRTSAQRGSEREAEVAGATIARESGPRATGDPGMMMFWGSIGAFPGAVLGYLFRPSVPLLGQLPFSAVITRGASLSDLDRLLLTSTAQQSFNYVVIGALIGAAIGAFIGYKQTLGGSDTVLKERSSNPTVGANAETLTNDAVIAMITAGLGDDVILEKIRYSRSGLNVSASELAQLKQRGVSDRVISAMLQRHGQV